MKILPAPLRARVEGRPHLQKVLSNSGWLLSDKILRMGVGLVVGVWVARYLGPEQFGLLNYGMAIVAIFGAIAGLGLNGLVVRDLVEAPEDGPLTLGSSFVLQLVAGAIAFALALVAATLFRPDEPLVKLIVAVLGLTLVLKASDVVKYWFEAQVRSKHVVWVENGVFLVLALVRAGLIVVSAPLMTFVWAALAEAAVAAAVILLLYARTVGKFSHWRATFTRSKRLLSESWPLMLVAVASMINMRVDQVMLGAMTDDIVVGNYSAAVRISEIWLMIPGVVGASIFPSLVSAKKTSEAVYRARILRLSALMASVVVPAAAAISLSSTLLTDLLYGDAYRDAHRYLAILIWSGVPYLIFFVFNQMYYIERLTYVAFYVAAFAVLSNVVLNALLIPEMGGQGAAIATLVTAWGAAALSLTILNVKTGIFCWAKS